tara:strand:+ start:236 stop:1051 length:816 start_codon:yes stop_codon:yes gene_type:complete
MIRVIENSGCHDGNNLSSKQIKMDKKRVDFIFRRKIRAMSGRRRLGVAWLILDPILLSSLYLFVFTVIRSNPDARVLFIGISLFRVFQNSFKSGVSSVNDFSGGIRAERIRTKVFSRAMLKYRVFDSFIQGIGIAVILLAMGINYFGVAIFILSCVTLGVLSEGVALNLALLLKRMPDLYPIVNNYFLLLMFFGSPAFYSMTLTNGLHYRINEFNPFAYFVEGVRYACGTVSEITELSVSLMAGVTLTVIFLSFRGYSSLDRQRWEASSWS